MKPLFTYECVKKMVKLPPPAQRSADVELSGKAREIMVIAGLKGPDGFAEATRVVLASEPDLTRRYSSRVNEQGSTSLVTA